MTGYENKKMTFLGDSITYGVVPDGEMSDRYATLLCQSLGAQEHNMGMSGTVLCTGHAERDSRLPDISSIPLDSDYVFIMLGTNDFYLAAPGFAELGEKGTTDTTTLYGAAEELCRLLAARFANTDTVLYVVTPVLQFEDVAGVEPNGNGYTMRQFCETLMEVCADYGIGTFDMNRYGGLAAADLPDGIHPGVSGTAKMAAALKSFLLNEIGM